MAKIKQINVRKHDLRNWHIYLKAATLNLFGSNVYKSILASISLKLKYMCQLTLYCDICVSPGKLRNYS
jgi:hypothetical protein